MITARNLSKSYAVDGHPVPVLVDVSLDITAGALFGVLGGAGAGKSTLLGLLGLHHRPDSGSVAVDGADTASLSGRSLLEVRAQFTSVSPAAVLLPERTVAGNVAAPLERLGLDAPARRKRVLEVLDLAGLSVAATQLPGDLDEGKRRRVALARALATSPSVLLADDLTAGLDAQESGGILATLDRARAELSTTVIVATRDSDVVRKLCDQVAVLEGGTIIEHGTVLGLATRQTGYLAGRVLPALDATGVRLGGYDRVADVVLTGHASVNGALVDARSRFGVEMDTIDGGTTRVGDVPVARYRLGVRGARVDAALDWLAGSGASVHTVERVPAAVAHVVGSRPAGTSGRRLAGIAA